MSVITLSLKWGTHPKVFYGACGWGIRIMGLNPGESSNVLSKDSKSKLQILDNTGEQATLISTPSYHQKFSSDHGALASNIPLESVTGYLNTLNKIGYKVVGSQTLHTKESHPTLIWTLQK